MSVETLRKAAELLRERASKATPGPWEREWAFSTHFVVPSDAAIVAADNVSRLKPSQRADAEYIASVHPLVGLAVADLLEDAAQEFADADEPEPWTEWPAAMKALAVARAILGEEP